MTVSVSGRKQIDILHMYEALRNLGHDILWLRENSGQRFLITWDNLTVAHYNSSLNSWCLRKYADVVNDNPDGDVPPGEELTELPDAGIVNQLMWLGY